MISRGQLGERHTHRHPKGVATVEHRGSIIAYDLRLRMNPVSIVSEGSGRRPSARAGAAVVRVSCKI